MKRELVALTVGTLLCALPAMASNGGGYSLHDFCLEAGGKRVLYSGSQGGESGCSDTLLAVDVQTGRSSTVIEMECDDDRSGSSARRREKLLSGCVSLMRADAASLGLSATVESAGQFVPLIVPDPPDDPGDFRKFREASYAQRLVLRRAGSEVGRLDFSACVFDRPPVASVELLVLPKKPFAVLKLTYPGICYESGYLSDALVLLPSLFGSEGVAPASKRRLSRPLRFVLKPPRTDMWEILLAQAKHLELEHKAQAAARYREESRKFMPELTGTKTTGCLEKDGPHFVAPIDGAQQMALDLMTNEATQSTQIPRLAECMPVQSEWLDVLGMEATVRAARKQRTVEQLSSRNDFDGDCPQELVITRNGQPFAVHPFSVSCFSQAPLTLVVYPLPGKQRVVFYLTLAGDRQNDHLFAVAVPGLKATARTIPTDTTHWLLSVTPSLGRDTAQVLNDAGMALYRMGSFGEAATSFGLAWQESLNAKSPLHLALFNLAATQSRLSRLDEALDTLRQLLSFSSENQRFVGKIRRDDDFSAMRNDPRLEALLTEPDCCLQTFSTSREKGTFRWRDGQRVRFKTLSVWNGKKMAEFDEEAGFDRAWDESGQLMREVTLVGGQKNGVERSWSGSGKLLEETTFVDGVKSGPHRAWDDSGQLRLETFFVDGAPTGKRRYFASGKPESEAWLVEGQTTGSPSPSRSWFESGQLSSEARFVDKKGAPLSQSDGGFPVEPERRGKWLQVRTWYPSGQIQSEARYVKGVPQGPVRRWSQDGGTSDATR